MRVSLFKNRKSRFNIFILLALFFLGASITYYIYCQLRSKVEIFATVRLIKEPIPYWVANSVEIGDKVISPLGEVTTEVIDKEVYEVGGAGQSVYLLLRIKAIRDRSGQYLFKNKPLLVGAMIDMQLTKTEWPGFVIYMGKEPPKHKYKKLTITVNGKQIQKWVAESLKVGSTIVNNKGQILAKVIDKKVTPAEVRVDTASGKAVVSYDETKRDLEATMEILVKEINGIYYFAETDKVKIDEQVTFYFKDITLYPRVISINKIEDVTP